jgi:hypothetical protein
MKEPPRDRKIALVGDHLSRNCAHRYVTNDLFAALAACIPKPAVSGLCQNPCWGVRICV